jgi:hypothetical protein
LWNVAWRGSDSNHYLWLAHPSTNDINVNPQEFSSSGPLGSAPTIAETHPGAAPSVNQDHLSVFWKGADSALWEASYNGTTHNWSLSRLGMGPLE